MNYSHLSVSPPNRYVQPHHVAEHTATHHAGTNVKQFPNPREERVQYRKRAARRQPGGNRPAPKTCPQKKTGRHETKKNEFAFRVEERAQHQPNLSESYRGVNRTRTYVPTIPKLRYGCQGPHAPGPPSTHIQKPIQPFHFLYLVAVLSSNGQPAFALAQLKPYNKHPRLRS